MSCPKYRGFLCYPAWSSHYTDEQEWLLYYPNGDLFCMASSWNDAKKKIDAKTVELGTPTSLLQENTDAE